MPRGIKKIQEISLISKGESEGITGSELKEYAIMSLIPALKYLDIDMLLTGKNSQSEVKRMAAYSDYDEMEQSIPEVKTALDIYADVACMGTEGDEKAFDIECKDKKVITVIKEMVKRLDLYTRLWSISRDVRKYGDDFEYLEKTPKVGITRIKNLSVYTMFRIEDEQGNLKKFEQRDFKGKKVSDFDGEELIHLRFDRPRNAAPQDDTRQMYGLSILFPLRRLYTQLLAMEEGMILGRLNRSHMRYKIVVDVTGKSTDDAKKLLLTYKQMFKKKRITNPLTGRLDVSQAKLLDPTDDFFIGARKDGVTPDVSTVSEQGTLGQINDVLYFQNKLFAVLKLPKSFMASEKDVNAKCLKLSTKIPCVDGKIKTLKQIINTYEKINKLPYVYSYDKDLKKITVGKVIWAGITKQNTQVVEVTLDDGSKQVCTPEHKWYLLDGKWVEAQNLKVGSQLLPLRRSIKTSKSYKGYEKIYDPYFYPNGRSRVALTHQRVVEVCKPEKLFEKDNPQIHHIDNNKLNNHPDNLEVLSWKEHLEVHNTTRFGALSKFRKENGSWNKGIKKGDGSELSKRLSPITYVTKKCLVCETEFTVPLSKKKKIVCSKQCVGKRSGLVRHVDKQKFNCNYCGKEFMEYATYNPKYCSPECHYSGRSIKAKIIKQCLYCGDNFESLKGKNRAFCSKQCSNTYGNKDRAGLIPVPNHRVLSVKFLNKKVDTGDITVDRYHNFFISDIGNGGVLVHNSTLAIQDVEFGRTVRRLQTFLASFVKQLCDVELQFHGISDADYKIKFANVSITDENQKTITEKVKADMAVELVAANIIDKEYAATKILNIPMEDFKKFTFTPSSTGAAIPPAAPPPPPLRKKKALE